MGKPFGKQFDEVFADRLREADEFYKSVTPPSVSADAANVMRQALAGMLWSKQFFFFDGDNWLDEHNSNPLHSGYRNSRNSEWFHMLNKDIISMPDKWEYPWYAAWDLAFHTLPLAIVDPDFAKEQMELMLKGVYLHPSGQIPAYEWNFSDVNPPVHAWATLFLHRTAQALGGETDVDFLRAAFNKLMLNFTWWANRKDRFGKNVFEGGFLGLDNIGVFDRSAPLPTGGHLEQADGTAWMALFSQNMTELAIELAAHDPIYEDMVLKFVGAVLLHCRGHEPSRARTACGTRRTASTTTCCGSPMAAPRGSRCVPWWDCCPCAPRRSSKSGSGSAFRGRWLVCWNGCGGYRSLPNTMHPTGPGHLRRGRSWIARRAQSGAAPPDPHEDARRERVPWPPRHPLDLEVSRAASLRLPRAGPGVPSGLSAGRVEHGHVRRQFQLARAGLDAGERHDHPGPAAVTTCTTATTSRSNAPPGQER